MQSSRQYYRRGLQLASSRQSHTDPVSFVDVRRRFGFRSISIGRWVTEEEKNRAAGLFYDALQDLMTILQGPESLVSLRESLSCQYGIGGRPGVSAFYDPSARSFSLAKNAGPGSIAHEWFHALDHYLADKAFGDASQDMYASEAWMADATPIPHPINDYLFACFSAIMLNEAGDGPSEMMRISTQVDKAQGCVYFSKPVELCARAFEAFIQDAAIANNFLVSGTKATEEARMGLYPAGTDRERINEAFSIYFSTLGRALYQSVG